MKEGWAGREAEGNGEARKGARAWRASEQAVRSFVRVRAMPCEEEERRARSLTALRCHGKMGAEGGREGGYKLGVIALRSLLCSAGCRAVQPPLPLPIPPRSAQA